MTDLRLRFKEPRPLGRLLNQPGELIGVGLNRGSQPWILSLSMQVYTFILLSRKGAMFGSSFDPRVFPFLLTMVVLCRTLEQQSYHSWVFFDLKRELCRVMCEGKRCEV